MKGWILDIYPDLKRGKMVLWLRTKKGCHKVMEEYDPEFYLSSSRTGLSRAEEIYRDMGFETERVKRKTSIFENDEKELLNVSSGEVFDPRDLAEALSFFNGYDDMTFYDVDVPLSQRYLIDEEVRPFSLVEKDDGWKEVESSEGLHYSKPPLKVLELKVDVEGQSEDIHLKKGAKKKKLESVEIDSRYIEGEEVEILQSLDRYMKKEDPDVILTEHGDQFYLPYLQRRAELNDVSLTLGREKTVLPSRDGFSYQSYGRVEYRSAQSLLKGRIHIDKNNSFLYKEGRLDGLIEVSRLCKVPLQRLSRRSPGHLINAMETEQAMKEGHLIPWKRNIPEKSKSASHLIGSDRGGHTFDPEPGVYDHIIKMDFASMYPTIIDEYNLSPETLGCDCGHHNEVPGLGYKFCTRKKGLLPEVISPIIKRRQAYKKMAENNEEFKRRAKLLKWILVTCFGYTGYKKARFNCIEVHESITAYGRDILLQAAESARKIGFEVIHGIVDSLWLDGPRNRVEPLVKRVEEETKVELEEEGVYSWLVLLPTRSGNRGASNRYYGVLNGELEAKGVHMSRRDTPEFIKDVQKRILKCMKKRKSKDELEQFFGEEDNEVDKIIRRAIRRIKTRGVPSRKMCIKRTPSRKAGEYEHMTEIKAAMHQYEKTDLDIHPGQEIRYIVTDSKSDVAEEKVAVLGDIEGSEYDTGYYVDYLLRAVEEILAPFGYKTG